MTSSSTQGCSTWLCQRILAPLFSGTLLLLVASLLTLLYLYGYGGFSARQLQDVSPLVPVSMAMEAKQTIVTSRGPVAATKEGLMGKISHNSLGFNMAEELMRLNPEILATIPRKTLPEYKNPCWFETVPETELDKDPYRNTRQHFNLVRKRREGRKLEEMALHFRDRLIDFGSWHARFRCAPYFYVIGMPKCGTTDLYYRLIKHPDVVAGLQKEPHWWTRWRLGNRIGFINKTSSPIRGYLDLFDEAAWLIKNRIKQDRRHDVITGESSGSTLWDNRWWRQELWNTPNNEPPMLVANLLRAVQPRARLIVTLRDPAERLYSDYLYFTEGNKSVENFHDRVVRAINVFNNCLKNNSLRACAYEPNLKGQPRLRLGLYGVYLRDWFSIFPRDQILVVRLEDHAKRPRTTMTRIFKFLQLGPVTHHKTAIFGQSRKNSRKANDVGLGRMLLKTRRLLDEFYGPHNRRLAALLDDKRYLWLKDGSMQDS